MAIRCHVLVYGHARVCACIWARMCVHGMDMGMHISLNHCQNDGMDFVDSAVCSLHGAISSWVRNGKTLLLRCTTDARDTGALDHIHRKRALECRVLSGHLVLVMCW